MLKHLNDELAVRADIDLGAALALLHPVGLQKCWLLGTTVRVDCNGQQVAAWHVLRLASQSSIGLTQ